MDFRKLHCVFDAIVLYVILYIYKKFFNKELNEICSIYNDTT